MMETERVPKICPKCGEKITYIERRKIGRKVYLYAVHRKREGTKSRVKRCYLGKESPLITEAIMGQEKGSIPQISGSITETIRITKDELQDVLIYYDKRRTKELTKERRDRAKEIFRKVFTSGRRVIEVEG
jgi:hypothetical protein